MSGYDRLLVERLLSAVWDESYAYGMEAPTAPPPDMPKAKANPAHGNTLYAHLADIKAAWRGAYIPLGERQALLLRYGMGWREKEIGAHLSTPQQTVSDWLVRGVGRLMTYLNGDSYTDGASETEDGSDEDQ